MSTVACRLLSHDVIEVAVRKQLSDEKALLLSWRAEDFTRVGDNYASSVTCLKCNVKVSGEEEKELSFVSKLNPCRQLESFNKMVADMFMHESYFLCHVVKDVNNVLLSLFEPPLQVPVCYYSQSLLGKEALICSDLRTEGFSMVERYKGLDKYQTMLTIKELARLHAASYVLKQKAGQPLLSLYPKLYDMWGHGNPTIRNAMGGFFVSNVRSAIRILEKAQGYEKSVVFLKNIQDRPLHILIKQLNEYNDAFSAICHGDIWSNNILFRYSEEVAAEVCLVDFQLCRVSSLATDLNHFLFTSVLPSVRDGFMDAILDEYFQVYSSIVTSAGMAMPFTFGELQKEFEAKHYVGLIMGIMQIGAIIPASDDIPNVDTATDDDVPQLMKKMENIYLDLMDKNALFRHRVLSLFKYLTENSKV